MAERVFDHLAGSPPDEDKHFSRVAHRMRKSEWWRQVPTYQQPREMSGEIVKGASQ